MEEEISISDNTLALLTAHDSKACKALADELLDDANFASLSRLCDPFCTDNRGTVMDCSIIIYPENVHLADDMTGVVFADFDEEVYNGCPDLDKQDDRTAELPFRINTERSVIVFPVAERPHRVPNEEF